MNRIVAGYLYLFGVIKSNFNMPLYSPFGDMGLLGTSPLPRAYTGLGFSDSIQVYVKSQNNEYLINLDFQTFDTLARGHLYKYDVYLHSIFWPLKSPEIEFQAKKIVTYMICKDQEFLDINRIEEKPLMAVIARINVVSSEVVWTKDISCSN